MVDTLPVQELVLYKHGICSITRRGRAAGREVQLVLRRDEVDDVLKSLVAVSLDEGNVAGVRYDTPDHPRRLSDIRLSIGEQHSLFDLVRAARGTDVVLQLESGASLEGRVVGIEEHPQGREQAATIVLLVGDGSVEQVASDVVRRIELRDAQLSREVDRCLDAGRLTSSDCMVRVILDEPGREVQLSYTIPFPVWRVSYRLVGVGTDALLQGWAVLDNLLEEDLEHVDVALIAGQPVSFRYDLTGSVIPERRFVSDEGRIAPGPIEFEGPVRSQTMLLPPPLLEEETAAYAYSGRRSAPAAPRAVFDSLASLDVPLAEGRDLDELTEYRIMDLSVGRGESAMIPVVQQRAPRSRELLYNRSKQPHHPVVAVRLRNGTGLGLERGPVTIVDGGEYRGEAMLPFTKPGGEIVLAYAVELGIRVLEQTETTTELSGLSLRGSFLHVQESLSRLTRYSLVNRTEETKVVAVEQEIWSGAKLVRTRAPDEQTGEHHRWRVDCRPGAETIFEVREQRMVGRREVVMDQDLDVLSDYLRERFLDRETRRALTGVVRLLREIERIEERIAGLRAELDDLAGRQDRLRKNIEMKASGGQEAEIRRRSAEEFSRTQDREAAIDAEMSQLAADRKVAQEKLQAELDGLSPRDG